MTTIQRSCVKDSAVFGMVLRDYVQGACGGVYCFINACDEAKIQYIVDGFADRGCHGGAQWRWRRRLRVLARGGRVEGIAEVGQGDLVMAARAKALPGRCMVRNLQAGGWVVVVLL